MNKEVRSMHKRRESDENIEIVACIVKYKTINEGSIDEVSERLNYIREELVKRYWAVTHHYAKENNNDQFVKKERARLNAVLKRLRKAADKNTCETECSENNGELSS